jgi:mRNA interferase YafQ
VLKAVFTSKFKNDLKSIQNQSAKLKATKEVMKQITNETALTENKREHELEGEYEGYMECHVKPDWLLIYKIDHKNKVVYFQRTGSHSKLFKQ